MKVLPKYSALTTKMDIISSVIQVYLTLFRAEYTYFYAYHDHETLTVQLIGQVMLYNKNIESILTKEKDDNTEMDFLNNPSRADFGTKLKEFIKENDK